MPIKRVATIEWLDRLGEASTWPAGISEVLSEFNSLNTQNVSGNRWRTVHQLTRVPSVTDKQLALCVIEAWQKNFPKFEIVSVTIASKDGAEIIVVDETKGLTL